LLRIVAGQLKGRRLKTPAGDTTRPTSDRVREALFGVLGGRVVGARVADLFAGSGALGLEALSRGAARCLFVERRRNVLRVLRANIAALDMEVSSRVLMADAAAPSDRLLTEAPFDLVLADPPYGRGFVARLTRLGARPGFLAPGGLLVIEHAPAEPPLPEALHLSDHRRYGQTELSFLIAA
jgi:16S rRNA (guanine966-N2)-methyltransferase